MEKILELAKKQAEQAEVFYVTSDETPVQFEANRLKNIQSKQSISVALRIVKDGRIGYATATSLDNAEELVGMAVETAEFGMKAEFEFPGASSYPEIEVFDPAVDAVSTDEMVALGNGMIDVLRKHTADLQCEAAVSKGSVNVEIINSRGGKASYRQSVFSIAVEGTLIKGTDMLFVGDHQSSCHPVLESSSLTGKVLEQLDHAKNRAAIATGSLPVIFTPGGIASSMAMPLTAAFNGKTVLEGASPIGDKLEQQVFDTRFFLRDDPTIPYRPASGPCDEEGVPSRVTPLIEAGTVKNFLYDLQTAALAGKASTGNGHRMRGGLPAPSPSALVIGTGDTAYADMLADIKEGLVVEQLMGAEQGNILGGDFSGNVLLGFKVENGKIVGRVKDTMVSGNIYTMLREIAAIGAEAEWVGGFLNTPYLYFTGVAVASK